nr:RNA-directed DNA polymerase, eukaryota [Tanacetum cinerariifolium]
QVQDLERCTNKSPGPDGFSFEFYRKYWTTIDDDVFQAVRDFFVNGHFPRGCNSSFISLIPKIQDAKFMKDFRPISLIGSVCKIIEKILANRLCVVLPYLISDDVQSAFVANRQTLDRPFILNELLSWCKFKKLNGMIYKVDFEKAFDYVKWDYLDKTLKAFGFGLKWYNWISSCLNNAMRSVLVNGSPTLEFQFYKGLKQGDPISSFLFILIMETLHLTFKRVLNVSVYKGISLNGSFMISHLFYADDVVFIGEWNNNNIQTLLSVLRCFYLASGLKNNLYKSKLMGIGVSSSVVAAAASLIGCSILTTPFNYLGVKVGSNMSRITSWDDVISKAHKSFWLNPLAIDNTFLPKAEVSTRWLRIVPIKCGNILSYVTSLNCNSETGNSFTYDTIPESYDEVPNLPPQCHFNIYLSQICESNSHYGYECSQRVPLIYEPKSCYIQNFSDNDYSHDLSGVNPLIDHHCCYECGNSLNEFLCYQCTCEFCRNGAHVGYNCPTQVPSFQTLPSFPQQYPCCEDCGQYTVNHPILNVHNDILTSQTTIVEQMTQLTSMCEMFCQFVQKKQEEKRIEEEQAAKAQNWKLPICYDDDDDKKRSNSLHDNSISGLPPCSAITPNEPVDSLSMGDEHLNTIPATESDEFIKSCVENLVPNPSDSKGENGCDVPACFTTFSNILFDADYKFDSVDDQSLFDEDVSEKIFSNPLFEEEIIPIRIDQHPFNAEFDLIESILNHDSSIIPSSSKIDSLLDEFAGELTLLKSIPPGIDGTDYHPENKIRFIERLFDSRMEEIDLSFNPDDPMLPSIMDDDNSKRDILILEEFPRNYSLSLPINESFYFDIPSFSHPLAKPPDGNTRILNIKMMGDISDQKVPIPRLMITRVSNQEKSPDLSPHRGLEIFKVFVKCPMMIHGKTFLSGMFLFSILPP